jgi:hypothetical protein
MQLRCTQFSMLIMLNEGQQSVDRVNRGRKVENVSQKTVCGCQTRKVQRD